MLRKKEIKFPPLAETAESVGPVDTAVAALDAVVSSTDVTPKPRPLDDPEALAKEEPGTVVGAAVAAVSVVASDNWGTELRAEESTDVSGRSNLEPVVDAAVSVVPAGYDEVPALVDAVVDGEAKEPTSEVREWAPEVKESITGVSVVAAELTEPATELGVVTAELTEPAAEVDAVTAELTELAIEVGVVAAELTEPAAEVGVVTAEVTESAIEVSDAASEVAEDTTEDTRVVGALSVVPEGADETSPCDPDAVALSVVVADPAADWLVVGAADSALLDSPRVGSSVVDTDIGAEVGRLSTTVVTLTIEVTVTSSFDDEDKPVLSVVVGSNVVVGNKDDRKPSRSFLSVIVVLLASPIDDEGGGAGIVVFSTARLTCLGK